MAYSGGSPILGQGTVSAEAIDAWFANRGPAAAKEYAPDRTYKPAPAGLGAMIVHACVAWGVTVNHDLIAVDIAHESAFWQSAIVRDKNNPSGLGAVNNNAYNGAVWFARPEEGIAATVAHMLSYAVGNGPWAGADPRYEAVKAKGWLGTAPTLAGLNGKWAYPGTTYGQGIASAANALVDFANNGTWVKEPTMQPPAGWSPPQIVRRILPFDASNTPGVKMRGGTWDYITIHNTGNPSPTANALMHASYLEGLAARGATEPSWHATVDERLIVQHLEEDWASWQSSDGDGDGNMDSYALELVEIGDQEWVLWNAAWYVSTLMKGRDIAQVDAILRQHHDWARDKKNCPRLLRANNGAGWDRLKQAVRYFLDQQPALADDAVTLNGFRIYGGIFQAWKKAGGLSGPGLPITDEMDGASRDATRMQWFERGVAEWHPGQWPENHDVTWGLVGSELYQRLLVEVA